MTDKAKTGIYHVQTRQSTPIVSRVVSALFGPELSIGPDSGLNSSNDSLDCDKTNESTDWTINS